MERHRAVLGALAHSRVGPQDDLAHATKNGLGGFAGEPGLGSGVSLQSSTKKIIDRRACRDPPVVGLDRYASLLMSPNAAPCGSDTIENRPPGKSAGGSISRAPSSTAFLCALSTSE